MKKILNEFNISQYNEIMEQEFGFYKDTEDAMTLINQTCSEVKKKQNTAVSQTHESHVVNYQKDCNLSYFNKSLECKRRVFKSKKNRRRRINNTYNDKVLKLTIDKRNNSTQDKIEKLRRFFANNQFEYDEERDVSKLILPFYLKSYSLTKSTQNPMKSCRFYEYIFPFDSELYCSESGNIKEIYEGLKLHKRIYRTEHNTLKKEIKFFFEEKDLNIAGKNNEGILKAYDYFCDWLKSLNNAKAKFFSDALIQFKEQIHQRTEQTNKIINPDSCGNISSKIICRTLNHRKIWLEKLDKNTKKWQKRRPYIKKTLRTGQENEITELDKVTLNYSMFDFLGYTPNVQGHNACLNIISIFASINNFNEMLNNKAIFDWNVPNVAKPAKQFNVNMIDYGNKSKTSSPSLLFNETWVFKDYHFRRSYWVINNI